MAVFHAVQVLTYEANTDLRLYRFCAVKFVAGVSTGPHARIELAAAGDRPCGVLMDNPNQYKGGAVVMGGKAQIKVDGSGTAIAAGDPLKPGAGGLAVKATGDKDKLIGWAEEESTASGDVISARVTPFDLAV